MFRVPIDAPTAGADHFIPGLAVDLSTSAAGAHLALTYYSYRAQTPPTGRGLGSGIVRRD